MKTYAELNSASAETLRQIVDETKQLVPNDQYGLIVWSHAMGWLPSGHSFITGSVSSSVSGQQMPKTRYCGLDEHPGGGLEGTCMLEIDQMAEALTDEAFEYILFDVCLMGNIESLYQLRACCHYFVASPTEVLAEASYHASGMPYEKIMPQLFGSEEDLAAACRQYYDFYNEKSGILCSASISLIDAWELDSLYLTTQSILKGKLSAVGALDVSEIQVYHTDNVSHVFFDLGDYVQQIASASDYQLFEAQLKKVVVYKASTSQFANVLTIDKDRFSGLSTYIPLSKWKNTKEYLYYFQKMNWSHVYD